MYTTERLACVQLTFGKGVTSAVSQPHRSICSTAEEKDAVATDGTPSHAVERAHRVPTDAEIKMNPNETHS